MLTVVGGLKIKTSRFKADLFRPYFTKNPGNTQSIAEILLFCLNEKHHAQNCHAPCKKGFWSYGKAKVPE